MPGQLTDREAQYCWPPWSNQLKRADMRQAKQASLERRSNVPSPFPLFRVIWLMLLAW